MQRLIGKIAAMLLSFIWITSRKTIASKVPSTPAIYAMWHGQHFLVPFAKPKGIKVAVLISKSKDGGMFAACIESLGLRAIRGAGAHGRKIHEKGGARAFLAILKAIKEGYAIAMTADVPKVSRECGLGIIKLAESSGVPIYPVATVSRWRITLKSWDKTSIGLPFSRVLAIAGEPVYVKEGDDLEAKRALLQTRLNDLTDLAYRQV
jgi:lysophospholipid acyltransferase (LPLAT)-like uncharacterized protein